MKKQIIVTFVIMQVLYMSAGTMQEIFLKGNAAYLAYNIDAALKLYQSIEPKGPAVWYNMGNCYYHLGNYPQAIVHWLYARKDASWRDRKILDTYITQSYEALGIGCDQSFVMRAHTWLTNVSSLCPIFIVQLLFLLCIIGLFFSLPRLLRQSRYYSIIVLSILIIFSGIFCIIKYREQKYPQGIVTKNSISVYAGPGTDYARLAEAKMLDKARVYQIRDGWLKAYFAQFGYGWIATADLAMI